MLDVSRSQILGHRRRVGGLTGRSPKSEATLRSAAWAGLQDSAPRAALLSLHARLADVEPGDWDHPSLIGVWGPRFSAYVVPEVDRAFFTLGRLPNACAGRDRSDRLAAVLGGGSMMYRKAGSALGVDHNALRYAAQTGRVALHWDGANPPVIWMVDRPDIESADARAELLRRYLHVYGSASAEAFRRWAGIGMSEARESFTRLASDLTGLRTPAGEEWTLESDEDSLRSDEPVDGVIRLLPSGDTHTLLSGAHRELLVPDPDRAAQLWPSRVWPGAVLVGDEVTGVWRRAADAVTITMWDEYPAQTLDEIGAEAEGMPIPGLDRSITVSWS